MFGEGGLGIDAQAEGQEGGGMGLYVGESGRDERLGRWVGDLGIMHLVKDKWRGRWGKVVGRGTRGVAIAVGVEARGRVVVGEEEGCGTVPRNTCFLTGKEQVRHGVGPRRRGQAKEGCSNGESLGGEGQGERGFINRGSLEGSCRGKGGVATGEGGRGCREEGRFRRTPRYRCSCFIRYPCT